MDGLSHATRLIIRGARKETGHDNLRDFISRRLRASFITLVREERADYRVLKAYVGHTAGDLLGEHYEHTSIDRMREEIVTRIESALAKTTSGKGEEDPNRRIAIDLH